ncbi:hypothetical protein G6F43_009740 [Rhizopus delemar]|nr:hypothetical protein G6F43_009740 [Rhizopus delemar]
MRSSKKRKRAGGRKLQTKGTVTDHYASFIKDTLAEMDTFPEMKGRDLIMDHAPIHTEQETQASEKKETAIIERGMTSPPTSPTPNKARQSRRSSEINGPQSPKRTTSPAVMSDIVQNQILQEQLEKLATEQCTEKPAISLPSPPITPAVLNTPESETDARLTHDDVPAARPRRLRPASSFAALRSTTTNINHHPQHRTHYVKRRPVSYVDTSDDDYLIIKKSVYDLSDTKSRRMTNHRIHKRLSEHELGPSDMSELLSLSLDERLLLCQQRMQQQQQQQQDTDTSSDSSQSGTRQRRMKRIDSAKSVASVSEKYEQLKDTLEKERAVVRALQKQKEACNRDIAFLSRNVEDLTAENSELKKKLDHEKIMKERFQDDLSSTMDKLNEATESIRQLENQNKQLKSEKDEKMKEVRELKRNNKPSFDSGKSGDRLLAAQLRHSQNQVRLLKSTMEQFLRMGVFNDDQGLPSNLTSPTTSVELAIFEPKPRQRARQSPVVNKVTKASSEQESTKSVETPENQESQKQPVEKKSVERMEKKNEGDSFDLDKQLRELLREKEILQAEYSKAPSSGGNALVRRRREELESQLDAIDSQMCRIKLKIRSRQIT